MLISLSKVDPAVSSSFVKILALAAYSEGEDFSFPQELKPSWSDWVKKGTEFVKTYNLDIDAWSTLSKNLVKGKTLYSDQDTVDAAYDLAKDLRVAIKEEIENENKVTRSQLALIKAFNTIAVSEKAETRERALNKMSKLVGDLRDSDLSRQFTLDVGDQNSVLDKLRKITTKMGGQDTNINTEIRSKYKGTDLLKQYNSLRRELNDVPKNFITNLVRQHEKPMLDTRKVIEELRDAGIRVHPIPEGFHGFIDDQLKYYTVQGKLINGTPAGEIRMNPDYDPRKDNAYVFEMQPPMAKNWARVYTEEFKARRTQSKFKKVSAFDKKAPGIRKRWLVTFKSDGIATKEGTLAMLAELVYQTSGRIGSTSGSTDGKATYGLSTLLAGHYYKQGNNRYLKYPGKKAQVQKHVIKPNSVTNKLLIECLDDLSQDKKRKDRLITFNNRPITATAFNKFLKSLGVPAGVTAHKFRTLKGTRLAKNILDNCPLYDRKRPPTSKQVNTWLKGALSKVAKELGHFSNGKLTIATAIANYIDPSILEEFYTRLGIRMPANVEKQVKLMNRG